MNKKVVVTFTETRELHGTVSFEIPSGMDSNALHKMFDRALDGAESVQEMIAILERLHVRRVESAVKPWHTENECTDFEYDFVEEDGRDA